MILNLTDLSPLPLYEQISRQLYDKIANGELREGTALLPVRTLARKERINVSTVRRAYQKLHKDGFIYPQGETGYQVAPLKTAYRKSSQVTAQYKTSDNSVNRDRLAEELKMAREIQAELLPKSLPDRLGFSLEGYIEPSFEIGGDFYNIIPLGEQKWGIVIGDACGKGLPAALLAAQTQAVVASEIRHKQNLQEVMKNVNQYIFSSTPTDKFVTLVMGIFNKNNRKFTYCIAGHEQPFIIREQGHMEKLKSSGPGLGLLNQVKYEINSITLYPKDMIFMFTDGINEVRDQRKNEYGLERLRKILKQNRKKYPGKIIDMVLLDLKKFSGKITTEDDRTILIMKIGTDN